MLTQMFDSQLLAVVFLHDYRIMAAVYFVVCFMVGLGGLDRRVGFWGHFLLALIMTPIVGVVVLCTSEPKPKAIRRKE
ncbi:hypothetical protein [Planctomycetes bacterium K23_9]|uniref:Uncharacterized protein n=1 Tax=Stieleria marina TaxID=1930275 RepID=A0A517P0L6_9BACT|nr:hypothetical protein K239x_49210 [Planctomycetes bacterium K23_9]